MTKMIKEINFTSEVNSHLIAALTQISDDLFFDCEQPITNRITNQANWDLVFERYEEKYYYEIAILAAVNNFSNSLRDYLKTKPEIKIISHEEVISFFKEAINFDKFMQEEMTRFLEMESDELINIQSIGKLEQDVFERYCRAGDPIHPIVQEYVKTAYDLT